MALIAQITGVATATALLLLLLSSSPAAAEVAASHSRRSLRRTQPEAAALLQTTPAEPRPFYHGDYQHGCEGLVGQLGEFVETPNYHTIHDEASCRAAGVYLSLPDMSVVDRADAPSGCQTYNNGAFNPQELQFNKNQNSLTPLEFNLNAGNGFTVERRLWICMYVAPAVTSFGEPHLANLRGEKFDVLMPGNHSYLVIPRGAEAQGGRLLQVSAKIEALGPVCGRFLFVSGLKFSGKWLGETEALHFSTSLDAAMEVKALKIKLGSSPRELNATEFASSAPAGLVEVTEFQPKKPELVNEHATVVLLKLWLGPSIVKVRMVYQKEKSNFSNSLWLTATGLQAVEGEIGGILGLDDHSFASRRPEQCSRGDDGKKMEFLQPEGAGRVHAQAAMGDIAVASEEG